MMIVHDYDTLTHTNYQRSWYNLLEKSANRNVFNFAEIILLYRINLGKRELLLKAKSLFFHYLNRQKVAIESV